MLSNTTLYVNYGYLPPVTTMTHLNSTPTHNFEDQVESKEFFVDVE